jgi:site-specific DNA-methyltransferase (adenine-specific)
MSLLAPDPIYDADGVRLFHGDCLTLMAYLAEPVDAVIGDLPYGTTQNHWDRELPNKLLWSSYHAICRPRTPIVLFGTGSFSARLIVENLAEYKYSIIWNKLAVSGHLNAKRQPLRCHEDLNVFYRAQPTYHPQMVFTGRASHGRGKNLDRTINHYGEFANTDVVEQDGYQYPQTIVEFKRPKAGKHPSQKPIELMRWLIRTYTNPGDVVLDNVCGSGTTLAAAVLEGRRAVGIELEEQFCETAIDRLAKGAEGDRW